MPNPDLRQYAGLCEQLERNLAQALAAARVVKLCVHTGQPGPLKRSAFELNRTLSTGIDLLAEISTHLKAEGL